MSDDERLLETLGEAQRLGFLGDAPLPSILAHARRFLAALPTECRRIADVGSGGGVPGLVLAHDLPDAELILIDRQTSRLDAVDRWIRRWGWSDRVQVVPADAAVAARTNWREWADAAVARGLGGPGVTAELTRGFVRVGGVVIVSEPPSETDRWPSAPLADLGLEREVGSWPGVVRLRVVAELPAEIPRRRPAPPRF
ncbi:MAG: RsmG family class I SAM-dependent methyltransferase [Ilumatobacteraceae bacterium]